jgi:hypothetical protein
MRQILATILILFPLIRVDTTLAQVPQTNFCGTMIGICMINGFGPAGYPCSCGTDPGQLIIPPNMGTVCGTQWGTCPVPPMYRGSVCVCGNGIYGRVIA